MNISHVLGWWAGAECALVCLLCLALCAGTSAECKRCKVPLDSWRFTWVVKAAALGFFALFCFLNRFQSTSGENEWTLCATLIAMTLAIFMALEVFTAWKAWCVARDPQSRKHVKYCVITHAVAMEALAFCSFRDVLSPGYPYESPTIFGIDPLYTCNAIIASVLLCGLLTRAVSRWTPLTRPTVCIVFLFFFWFTIYAAAVPLQGWYLVKVITARKVFTAKWQADCSRVIALQRLVPWLSSAALEELPTDTWGRVTYYHERPFDPTYMEQMRRAARTEANVLRRLWTLQPETARSIAGERIKTAKYAPYYSDASVLFLENPDFEVFKEFIPDDEARRELSQYMFRWATAAMPRGVKQWQALPRVVVHRLSVGYDQMRSELTTDVGNRERLFCIDNIELPERLVPAAIDFLVYTSEYEGYELLGAKNMLHAILATQALLEFELLTPYHGNGKRFDMNCFLRNVNRENAVACLRQVIRQYGEKWFLKHWQANLDLQCRRVKEMTEFVLDHWDEVESGAPTLQGERGAAAINGFLLMRINEL